MLGYIDPGNGFTFFNLGGWLPALLGTAGAILLLWLKTGFAAIKSRPRVTGLIVGMGLALLGGILWHMNHRHRLSHNIVILGLDGMSPVITERLLAEHRLPNFAAVAQNGSYRRLTTTNPPQSPVAWAGCVTGKNPGRHGIFDFIRRNPTTYQLSLSLSLMKNNRPQPALRAPTLWHYLSQARIPLTVLHCPLTFPPERIHGRMLSGMGVPDLLGTEGTFSFYTTNPADGTADTGGQVITVHQASRMDLALRGPRIQSKDGTSRPAEVPMQLRIDSSRSADLTVQGATVPLSAGEWSPWQPVSFSLGGFRRCRGIVKFLLISTEPDVKLFVSPINFDPRHPLFPISWPHAYSKEIAQQQGPFHTQGMPMNTWGLNERRITEAEFLAQADTLMQEKETLLRRELDRLHGGVLFSYFELPDIIQHMFWRYTDPLTNADTAQDETYRGIVEQWYERMDRLVGDVRKRLGPNDTLLILSDHGFAPFRRCAHLNAWLRNHGYLTLRDEHRSDSQLLQNIDWSTTRAYALGFGAIYLNLQGREQQGCVPDGKTAEQIKNELVEKLRNWNDPETGTPVVAEMYRREEIFRGPEADNGPDLFVGFAEGYRASWQTAIGGVPSPELEDNHKKWAGDHLMDPSLVPGIFFCTRAAAPETPSLYDIAPTVLSLAGITPETINGLGFDGRPLWPEN